MLFSKRTVLVFLVLTAALKAHGQITNFLIFFTDKDNTPYSIESPEGFLSQKSISRREKQGISILERDLPVDPVYVDSLESLGAQIIYTSRWFNAAYIEIDSSQVSNIYSLDFVDSGYEAAKKSGSSPQKSSSKLSSSFVSSKLTNSLPDYGVTESGFELIGIPDMHGLGYAGEGITIAVLDGGFAYADTVSYLSHLFVNGQVIATYDFVDRELDVYDDGNHGLQVLSLMASKEEGEIVGGAYEADYVLLRTENGSQETIAELVYWLMGAEFADSIGADIINSSLGYNTFDDSAYDFSYSDMDGNSTLVTQAADYAAETGMIVVCSAGNEGNVSWEKILAPADGNHVIAVGATNSSGGYANFSSQGPSFDGRVKPNVAARGLGMGVGVENGGVGVSSGTSLAAPQITSFAAGLWQALPEATSFEIKEFIERSGNQYSAPDDLLGFGIPNFLSAFNAGLTYESSNVLLTSQKVFPNPMTGGNLYLILGQEEIGFKVEINLYNLKGQELHSETMNSPGTTNRIGVSSDELMEGMYFLKVKTATGTYVHRLIQIN